MGLPALFAVLLPVPPAFAQSDKLTQGAVYDHEREVMVYLNSDSAKTLYLNFHDPNILPVGCFPAKLLNFVPKYKVGNIELVSAADTLGFVFGVPESIIPRVGEVLSDKPVYVVTSSTVVGDRQQEVVQPDLE